MKVQRLGFVCTYTDRYAETLRFFTEVLGLDTVVDEPDGASLQMPMFDNDYMDVIGPGCDDCDFEKAYYSTGPVVGFVVDDVVAARAELAAAGTELLGELFWSQRHEGYGWFHFRAPDGNVYGIMEGSHIRPGGG